MGEKSTPFEQVIGLNNAGLGKNNIDTNPTNPAAGIETLEFKKGPIGRLSRNQGREAQGGFPETSSEESKKVFGEAYRQAIRDGYSRKDALEIASDATKTHNRTYRT